MTIDTLSFQRTTDTLSLFQQGQLGGSPQSTIKADSDSLQLAQIHSAPVSYTHLTLPTNSLV